MNAGLAPTGNSVWCRNISLPSPSYCFVALRSSCIRTSYGRSRTGYEYYFSSLTKPLDTYRGQTHYQTQNSYSWGKATARLGESSGVIRQQDRKTANSNKPLVLQGAVDEKGRNLSGRSLAIEAYSTVEQQPWTRTCTMSSATTSGLT